MKAVIFDKDGVLIETFGLHFKSHSIVLAEFGVKLKKRDLTKRYGMKISEILKDILKQYGKNISEETAKKMASKKTKIYIKLVEEELKLLPGVREFLKFLKKKGYKIGLASSDSKETLLQFLRLTKTENFFDANIGGDEIKNGKPNPEIFLKCAKKLNVDPKDCFVVEDSVHGIKAAKRADMKTIAVTTGQTSREELQKMKPDWLLNTLEEFNNIEEL